MDNGIKVVEGPTGVVVAAGIVVNVWPSVVEVGAGTVVKTVSKVVVVLLCVDAELEVDVVGALVVLVAV